jgi:hypothetical protein
VGTFVGILGHGKNKMLQEWCVCEIGWVFGCLVVWLFGCLVVWLFGCLVVWLFVCLVVYWFVHLLAVACDLMLFSWLLSWMIEFETAHAQCERSKRKVSRRRRRFGGGQSNVFIDQRKGAFKHQRVSKLHQRIVVDVGPIGSIGQ